MVGEPSKEMNNLEVVIRGTPEEIAALVLAVQEWRLQKTVIRLDGNVNGLSQFLQRAKDDIAQEVQEKSSN